jgi:hypothetical protein
VHRKYLAGRRPHPRRQALALQPHAPRRELRTAVGLSARTTPPTPTSVSVSELRDLDTIRPPTFAPFALLCGQLSGIINCFL